MGGPSQSTLATQNSLTAAQVATQQRALADSEQDRADRQKLQEPAISYNSALSSGDPDAVLKAIAPQLTGITASTKANKESIFEQLGPGAARDQALAQNTMNEGNATAGLRANAVSSSFDKLANIGSGLGSFSLQELGAGISAGQAASSANQVSINAAEQSKASTLGFLGQLATAGASMGTKAIGCWIAEAIYGKGNIRTHLVRAWLNGPFRQTWYGRWVMRFYLRYGERIADFLNAHPWLKPAVRPLFDMALERALNDHETCCTAEAAQYA